MLAELYHLMGEMMGVALGYLLAQLLRRMQRSRFWAKVERNAERFIADPSVPTRDPQEAAQLALVEAQRAQLDAIQRSLESGGNGYRDGMITPPDSPRALQRETFETKTPPV